MGGQGRTVAENGVGSRTFVRGGWYNSPNLKLSNGNRDKQTGGLIGTIALPLLADFWTYPDSPQLPVDDPFVATGFNGWQVSVAVTSSPGPNFRIYSGGRAGTQPIEIGPSSNEWSTATGGYNAGGSRTSNGDNTVYWVMADFLKRTAVVTTGFVDLENPHRMPAGGDPRLGPYNTALNALDGSPPEYTYSFEPSLSSLPPGTAVIPEFRGAGPLAHLPGQASRYWPKFDGIGYTGNITDEINFPLDALKAGDAHIRHYDDRTGTDWWVYMYNDTMTTYTEDPNDLASTAFTSQFSAPTRPFEAKDVKYFNWRFIMKNNVESNPPVSPKIESFSVAYRYHNN
jgi:hypothetical protein